MQRVQHQEEIFFRVQVLTFLSAVDRRGDMSDAAEGFYSNGVDTN